MPRARRDLSTMRTEVRTLLRETDATNSYWQDALLDILINEAIDLRHMMLCDMHEGWDTEVFETNVVAQQSKYQLLEGLGRVKRVLWVDNSNQQGERVEPLQRHERWSEGTFNGTGITGNQGNLPTYRVVGEFLTLEPEPQVNLTNGLRIEIEVAPSRLTLGTDTLPLRYPVEIETLLIYDAASAALAVELSQGNADERYVNHIERLRREYELRFNEFTEVRSFGRTFASPYHLGD